MSVVYVFFLLAFISRGGASIVNTSRGLIRGQDEGSYTTFFGVPYALVDEANPFGASLPHPEFDTPFEANDSSIKCPQAVFKATGVLQCLRLNIYVPKTTEKNLPVFVWFHGGGFVFGSAGDYDGQYLAKQNLIVVTANYRLGPYGFFCFNTEEVPGNQGLKDQVEALKWVKNNIAAFGGDADKVTIAGESYGGASVELHLYSEFEKLFDKAIIQSGGVNDDGLLVKPNNKAAWNVAKILDPNVKRKEALAFLARTDPVEVMKAFNSSRVLLRVCLEKEFGRKGVQNFLTAKSANFNAPERVANTPILIGYNSKETFGDFMSVSDDYYEKVAPNIFENWLGNNFKLNKSELQRAALDVKKFYMDDRTINKDAMLALVDFTSDFVVNHPEERAVTRFLDQNGTVYKYLFSYIGNSPYKNVSGVGAYHTEELQYLFDWVDVPHLSGDDNLLMRDRMTAMWANFVKHGDPTPHQTGLLPKKWVQASHSTRAYLDIDLELQMKENVYKERMDFWDLFWKEYGKYYELRG